jgi:hypothetical protein
VRDACDVWRACKGNVQTARRGGGGGGGDASLHAHTHARTPTHPSHVPRITPNRQEVPYTHRHHAIMLVTPRMELHIGQQTFHEV